MYEQVTGSLVMALAKMDIKEYEEAKQLIAGALQLFDDEYQISKKDKTMVRRKNREGKKSRNSKK